MRRAIPIIVGALLVLVGAGWASQGAGILGGSSLMDNNPTFIYLGGVLAIVGIVLHGVRRHFKAENSFAVWNVIHFVEDILPARSALCFAGIKRFLNE